MEIFSILSQLLGNHTESFKVKHNIALTATVCIASFEAIGEL